MLVKPFKDLSLLKVDVNKVTAADAITESLTNNLQRYNELTVLSSSTGDYALEERLSNQEIRKLFLVDFLVTGTSQAIETNIRITAEVPT